MKLLPCMVLCVLTIQQVVTAQAIKSIDKSCEAMLTSEKSSIGTIETHVATIDDLSGKILIFKGVIENLLDKYGLNSAIKSKMAKPLRHLRIIFDELSEKIRNVQRIMKNRKEFIETSLSAISSAKLPTKSDETPCLPILISGNETYSKLENISIRMEAVAINIDNKLLRRVISDAMYGPKYAYERRKIQNELPYLRSTSGQTVGAIQAMRSAITYRLQNIRELLSAIPPSKLPTTESPAQKKVASKTISSQLSRKEVKTNVFNLK